MPVRVVESRQNARVKELRKALASPGRGPGSLAGIEGPNLVEEALRAGMPMATVFIAQGAESLIDTLCLPPECEVLVVPRDLLDSVLATETPQPIAALVEPPEWDWKDALGGSESAAPLVVVLAGIQDPGNLGTILRSAEAFGATGVITLPGTVSAWNPKAVRASAGSLFRLPLIAASDRECFERLHEADIRSYATVVQGAQPAPRVDLTGPAALLIGNEGNGLPPALVAKADAKITIPCPGPVESLNAAIATSVLLYEASRQRAEISAPARPKGARR